MRILVGCGQSGNGAAPALEDMNELAQDLCADGSTHRPCDTHWRCDRRTPGYGIRFGFAVLMNFGSYWFSDKIVLSMYGAQEIDESQAPKLYAV